MTRAVLICGDVVGAPGGAGQVTKNELMALQEVFGANEVGVLQLADVRPAVYAGLDVPYLWDYFALSQLHEPRFDALEHAHIYSGCYTETVRYLRSRGVTVSYTCPAHDRNLSMKERGPAYYLPHIDIPELWQQHSQGLRLANLVIVPGEAPRRFLESEGVESEHMVVIPHGIDSVPEQVAPFPEEFTIGYLGAVGVDKGVRFLVAAWGILDWPDARLLIAGEGSQQLESYIRTLAGKGRFVLLGWVPDPWEFYPKLSIYIQPSVEGFGIEVPEAMACGRPVIVSDAAGAADLVDPGETGWRVPFADTNALVEVLGQCYQHQDKLLAIGNRARKVAQRYTWELIRGRYIEVFRRFQLAG